MTAAIKGFPDRFPVRAGEATSLRYRISAAASRTVLRAMFGRSLRLEGADRVPPDGPLLVVANHLSNFDPLLFGGFFPRTLFAMAKSELYRPPLIAWWLAGCNCIPVDRDGADRRAVSRALAVLRDGGRLLIFIEGTRSTTGGMQNAEAGAGFLARRSGAAVQPVAIFGTERARAWRPWTRRHPVTMRFGAPVHMALTGRRDDAAIATEMAALIAELLPPRYRGVHGINAGRNALPATEGSAAP